MKNNGGSDLHAEPDEVLVERARQIPEAFGELYERYVGRIYRYLYFRTNHAPEAEDLTEQVFLQALAHLPSYRYRGAPFGAWLFTIAHNVMANWHRARSRNRTLPLESAPTVTVELEAGLERQEASEVVREAVGSLPAERQYLLLLKFAEERSNGEIAVLMGRSEGAIKALLHRTLRSLRQWIESRRNGVFRSQEIGRGSDEEDE